MGIDLIRGGRIANRGFRTTKSSNSYLKSLIKVPFSSFSSTPSSPAGLKASSTRSSIRDLTSPVSTDTPSPFHAFPSISPRTALPSPKEEPSTTHALWPSSEPSPTTLGSSTCLRDLESLPSSSPLPPAEESLRLEDRPLLLTSSLNLLPLARTSFS